MTGRVAGRKPRLDSLTSLRFFAALFVVIFHAEKPWLGQPLAALPRELRNFASTGYVSVGFFFILSGFVLAYTYGDATALAIDRRSFWRARFARVYPVFLLGLLLGAGPAWFALQHQFGTHEGAAKFAVFCLANTVMMSFAVPGSLIFNYPSWSLSAEAVFYLLFPWLAFRVWRLRGGELIVAGVIIGVVAALVPLAALAYDHSLAGWMADVDSPPGGGGGAGQDLLITLVKTSPLARLPDFILGIVVGKLFLERLPERGTAPGGLWSPATRGLAAVAAIIAVLSQADRIPYLLVHSGLLDLLFAYVIYELAMDTGALSRVLGVGWLVFLGEASYALYITHVPLRDWCVGGLARTGLAARAPSVVWFGFYLTAMVLTSGVIFKLVEDPMRQLLRDRKWPF